MNATLLCIVSCNAS